MLGVLFCFIDMVKYRRLTLEELKELELEFKQFLITHSIYDQEWREINKDQPEKAQDLVDLFSDLVLEKAYSQVSYLQRISAHEMDSFFFNEKNATWIALRAKSQEINFLSETWKENILGNLQQLECFSADKIIENKPQEIFRLLNQGCVLGDETLHNSLKALISNNS